MLSLAITAIAVPTASRTARATCARERGAVLERAAVAVGAPVEPGAEERAEQVVVAEVELDRRRSRRPGDDARGGAKSPVMRAMSAVGRGRA